MPAWDITICEGCAYLLKRAELAERQVAQLSGHIVEAEKDQYGNPDPDPDTGKSCVVGLLEEARLPTKVSGGE